MIVYLLVNAENKYKIGFTNRDVQKRIKELQVGSPSEIRVVREYETPNARQIETILHRFMKSQRISGEWFDLSESEVFGFVDRCKQIDFNLKYLEENKI